jgi:putative ABC transport system permease protein
MKILRQLRSFFRRQKLDAEMAEEMRAHLDLQAEQNIAAGMNPDEARYAAQRRFGNLAESQERCREQRFGGWIERLTRDSGFALRSLVRARGFSLTVIWTLSIGIGVAIMALKLAVPDFFSEESYPESKQLMQIGFFDRNDQNGVFHPFTWGPQFEGYQALPSFSEFAAAKRGIGSAVVAGEPLVARTLELSRDSFHALGIKPALGRIFVPAEFDNGKNEVVIVSDLFWHRHLNAQPDVLGKVILVDQRPRTVVGVLKPGQTWPVNFEGNDVYLPLTPFRFEPNEPLDSPLFVIGRLRSGISKERALADFKQVIMPELPVQVARFFESHRIGLFPIEKMRVTGKTGWVVLAAAALLYLTACINVVNLMLVRLLGRQRELNIRLALGGARWRIVRLVALESVGLSLASGIVVTFASRLLFSHLLSLLTGKEVAARFLDWRMAGCIGVLSLIAGMATALLPVMRLTHVEIAGGLKDGGLAVGESRRLSRLRGLLVVLQAAFAVMLLSAAGLMMRSFEKVHAVDLGVDPVGLVKVQISFPNDYDRNQEVRLRLFDRLQEKLARLPGVKAITYGEDSVLTGGFWGREQVRMPDGSLRSTTGNFVTPNFSRVAGLTMKQGRWFSSDRTQNEVVVNETMARIIYGDRDPIEQTFTLKAYPGLVYRVVGVVHDVRESVRSAAGMRFYAPCWWYPPLISTLMLRLDHEPKNEFSGIIRHAIYEFDPRLLTISADSVGTLVENSLSSERFAFRVLKILSGIGLVLAMVGIFSTTTYTVRAKMREFGVRMALGALPGDLRRLVMKRSLITAGVGVVAGFGGSFLLTRFMQSLLFETTAADPMVHGLVALLLLAMTALACWLPARQAAKVDPLVALRAE